MSQTLIDVLPSPLPERISWPWTEASNRLPLKMPDGSDWPRISIVTPSYNQGKYLEETIRSVLLQGYPNLEYVIIDGGSIDDSVDIIQKYASSLAYWVSEKDDGQSHAINKGFDQTTGDIMAWLNSDDYLMPNALEKVAQNYSNMKRGYLFSGDAYSLFPDGTKNILRGGDVPYSSLLAHPLLYKSDEYNVMPCQPSVYWTRELYNTIGYLDESLHMAMDYEYWLRSYRYGYAFMYINGPISVYRFHETSKSSAGWDSFLPEWSQVSDIYYRKYGIMEKMRFNLWCMYIKIYSRPPRILPNFLLKKTL